MRIGVLSDSHGHAPITTRAVAALVERGVGMLIHLGDVGTTDVLDTLAGHDAHVVFGNCDGNLEFLADHARGRGITVHDVGGRITIGDKTIAFTHGHIDRFIREAVEDGVDYLLHGHTHELRDDRIRSTRVINPGALFRAARYTAVVLVPERDEVEVIDVPKLRPEYA